MSADTQEEGFTFVEDPTFDIDYKGDCAYEVKVNVAAVNRKEKADEMFLELKQEAQLPGFRRGKAPVRLLENKFAKHVQKEVSGKLVGEAFEKLVKDEELKPIGTPDIDGLPEEDEEINQDDALEFTLKFEVSPRVELGKYRGIAVERPVVKIDDKDLEEAIQNTLERHATHETVDKRSKSKEGDQVVIDFKGTVDGEEFDGGAAENYPYVLGSGRFMPEFEKALKGVKGGDEFDCDVHFPEDYFSDDLKDKDAVFAIKVHEIKRQKLPELDDDFAKEAGFEDEADLRSKIEGQLKEASANQSKNIVESRALEAIIEDSSYEMSQSMIDAVSRDIKQQELQQMSQQQLPAEQMQARMEEMNEMSDEQAIRNIKTMVTLNEIGEAEGIEVTEEDFEKEAEVMAKSMGMETQVEMVAQYMAQGDQRNTYADRIYRSKAMAVIMDNAKVTDKELTREEMEAEEAENSEKTEEKDGE
jgi:trigger factor